MAAWNDWRSLNLCQGFIFISELTTGCIDVLSPASAKSCIHPMLAQVLHKTFYDISIGFTEPRRVDRIVLDNIYQVGRYLAKYLNQFVSIFQAIIEIFEKNIFESYLVASLLVKIV